MDKLDALGLGFIVDSVPCYFTKRGAMHKAVFRLAQEVKEDGSMAIQVGAWCRIACQ